MLQKSIDFRAGAGGDQVRQLFGQFA